MSFICNFVTDSKALYPPDSGTKGGRGEEGRKCHWKKISDRWAWQCFINTETAEHLYKCSGQCEMAGCPDGSTPSDTSHMPLHSTATHCHHCCKNATSHTLINCYILPVNNHPAKGNAVIAQWLNFTNRPEFCPNTCFHPNARVEFMLYDTVKEKQLQMHETSAQCLFSVLLCKMQTFF